MPEKQASLLDTLRDRTTLIHILLILAAVAAAYANAVGNGFVTDDLGLLVDNPNTKDWSRLGRIFTTGYWDAEGGTGGLYRPLTIVSFLIEYHIGGLNPALYHVDNILIHFLCAVAGYLLMTRLFDNRRAPLFGALLFAAHPVHVEAVTWISGRAEILCVLFALLSVLAFIRRPATRLGLGLSYAMFAVGLLAKETIVVVPLLLAVWMRLYGKESGEASLKAMVKKLWPYAALTVPFMAARTLVLGGDIGPKSYGQAMFGLTPYEQFLTMCRAVYEYVRLGFFPLRLREGYHFLPPAIYDPRVLFGIAAVVCTVVFARRIAAYSKPVMLGLSWFFLSLLPVSNIIPTGIVMSERAMYLPSLGICMVMAAALSSERLFRRVPYGTLALIPVLGMFVAVSLDRNPMWHSQESFGRSYVRLLEEHTREYPDDARGYRRLASMRLRFLGYDAETEKAIQEAYTRIGHEDEEMRYLTAFSYVSRSMPQEGLDAIMYVINNMAATASDYFLAANALARLDRFGEADAMVDKAIDLNPNKVEFIMFKGRLRMDAGDEDTAYRIFETATELAPDNHDAYLLQGIILNSRGRFGEAIGKIGKAVELRPDIPDLHYFLAVAYLDAGQDGLAAGELKKTLEIQPDYEGAAELLGRLR